MSYLNTLRLHFAGQFQANVSTVNNDPAHFNNATFQPNYQALSAPDAGPGPQGMNGWFNPQGDAAFRLRGCKITSAWTPTGPVTASDPVLGYIVADSDGRVPAKLVDLDSEQQLVSEIWGLVVRIADANGKTLMTGEFEPAAFADIWDRATGGGGGDIGAGAMYQSVLRDLQWSDVSASPFLIALRKAADSGVLSIKFNVDGLNMDYTSPNFMCGRIAGTIGPASVAEPKHLVIGRQFMATAAAGGNFFTPAGGLNFCAALVDKSSSSLILDLGNALTTATPGGSMNNLGDLVVSTPGSPTPLGTISATGADGYAQDPEWYARTAGVVTLPLSATQLQQIESSPLQIDGNPATATTDAITIKEWTSGAFVRADTFVYRLSPRDTVRIPVYAMQWGKPLANVGVTFTLDSAQLQPTTAGPQQPYIADGPPVATPDNVLIFAPTGAPVPQPSTSAPPVVTTGSNGIAVLPLTVADPGNPRGFPNGIDGQVYGILPAFADTATFSGPNNQWNFISFLVWSGFTAANPVTWSDVQPIFQQYANLYPVMNRFLDMGDYGSVVRHAGLLQLAFGLNAADPNAMPVTRDLSPAKRAAILSFLANPLPAATPIASATPALTQVAATHGPAHRGGKAAAAARRLILQSA